MPKTAAASPNDADAAMIDQPTIRVLFLTALLNVLSEVDDRIDPLLRDYGFFRSQLDKPYERVPLHRYVALLEHAAAKFQRPDLGLEMGQSFGLADLGPFHALLRASGTLRGALDCLTLFQSRLQSKTSFDSQIGPDRTTYSYRIEDPRIWPRQQDAEFALSGYANLVRQLTSAKWSPAEVHLEHPITGRDAFLSRFFRAPVLGNQVANALIIRNEDLDKPLVSVLSPEDEKLKSVLERHLLDLMGPAAAPGGGLVALTKDIIARRLGRARVDCALAAAELKLSERSLRRRLMEEGTSFRALLQEARQERARLILAAADLPLSVAAEQLGYSDTATFSRAFKDWTGISPGRYSKNTR
ncbi:AraC family transcriptional regulator [Nitrospirillum sp. BR 11163]|uniref:AraC family transcriptional regulator n=1 Tax=Nitrospirillum sp. BR 11163 TaxID=3104323 RepID=UPI002AFF0BFE|nr:AraC family transcriptional regulator ligand-binding domain-containing protein [Nitrospirillum sp. BR 11163]MEA1674599.1 AraC family transcriptional regulator ligand-binding domain-containing protein [Nitrospirillum sp. BR 11163]